MDKATLLILLKFKMVTEHSDLVLLQYNLTVGKRTKSCNWVLLDFMKLSKCKNSLKILGKNNKKKHLKILLDSELSLLHIIPVAIAPVYDLINLGWKLWRPAWIRRKGLEQNKNQTVNKMHAFVLSEGHTG